jgi:EmrB/QacA subfamily drug resistance transporter
MADRPDRYKWTALSNTTLGVFMATLDSSIVIISLPAIFRGIHLDPLQPSNIGYLLWMLMGYLVVTAVLVVTFGRIGDMFGRVRMYNAGFAIFTVASIGLSLTPHTGGAGAMELIAMRVIQGIGGALLMANSTAILTDAFPVAQRGMAMGINMIAAMAGSFVGLVAGGLLADVHWRLVFWVNVPFGVFGTIWAYAKLREIGQKAVARIDWWGNVTFAVGLISVLVGITYGIQPYGGHTMGWTSPLVLTTIIGGAALLGVFCWIETRVEDPMVDLSLFRSRVFSGGLGAMVLWGFGVMGVYLFTAMYLQNILGFSPTEAGASIIPMALMMILMAPFAGSVARRLGTHLTVAAGLALNVVGLVMVSFVGEGGRFLDLLPGFVLFGIGSGFTMMPLNDAVIGVLPPARAGTASGVLNAAREISGLLGVTIIGAILTARQSAVLRGGSTPTHAFLSGYQLALRIGAVIVFVGVPLSLYALRTRRAARVQPEPALEPIA